MPMLLALAAIIKEKERKEEVSLPARIPSDVDSPPRCHFCPSPALHLHTAPLHFERLKEIQLSRKPNDPTRLAGTRPGSPGQKGRPGAAPPRARAPLRPAALPLRGDPDTPGPAPGRAPAHPRCPPIRPEQPSPAHTALRPPPAEPRPLSPPGREARRARVRPPPPQNSA